MDYATTSSSYYSVVRDYSLDYIRVRIYIIVYYIYIALVLLIESIKYEIRSVALKIIYFIYNVS